MPHANSNPEREALWDTIPKKCAMMGYNVFVGRQLRVLLKGHVKQLQVDLLKEFPKATADRIFELVRDNIYGWPS